MRINSIPERNCLTLENLTAWETKNYQQKKYHSKQKYVLIYFLVEVYHAHPQVSRDLNETMKKET